MDLNCFQGQLRNEETRKEKVRDWNEPMVNYYSAGALQDHTSLLHTLE